MIDRSFRSMFHLGNVSMVLFVLIADILCAHSCNAYAEQPEDPEEIIRKVIESRNNLESAEIILSETYEVNKVPDNAWKSMTHRYRFLFDKSNLRVDIEHHGVGRDGRPGTSTEQAIFRSDGSFIIRPAYSKEPINVSSNYSAHSASAYMNINPRLVGMFPTTIDLLWKYAIDDAFEYLRIGKINVEEIAEDSGKKRLRLISDFESIDGKPVKNEMLINPERGYAIEAISVSRPDFSYSLIVNNQEWASGTWFPRECIYEQHMEGKLFQRVRTIVENVQPLESVPPSEFGLTSIEMEEGRVVRKENAYYLWNGNELVRHPEDDPKRFRRNKAPSVKSFTHLLLIINAVVFTVVACFLIRRMYLRRSRT